MRSWFHRLGFGLFAVVICLTTAARAQTLAFTVPPGGADDNGGRQNFGSSVGLLFTLNSPLTISSLGYWDDNRDGVTNPIDVAIFDRSGTPAIVSGAELTFTGTLGTLTGNIVDDEFNSDSAPTRSGQAGQFRLANLSAPVELPAGQYALVAWGFDFSNEILNGSNDGPVLDINTFGGALTFDGSAFDDTNTPGAYPTTLDPSDGSIVPLYVAATFSPDAVSAVPEPADVALVTGALALGFGLVTCRRRRL